MTEEGATSRVRKERLKFDKLTHKRPWKSYSLRHHLF